MKRKSSASATGEAAVLSEVRADVEIGRRVKKSDRDAWRNFWYCEITLDPELGCHLVKHYDCHTCVAFPGRRLRSRGHPRWQEKELKRIIEA